jgi:hypothetical protein
VGDTLLYLLDANTIIESSTKFYQLNRVKPFWDWLLYQAGKGMVKIPYEIYEEVLKGNPDEFVKWFKKTEVRSILELGEDFDPFHLRKIVNEGYATDLNDIQMEKLGRDPFLISYAFGKKQRCVVTQEIPGSKKAQNRKIPDVCSQFNIPACSLFDVINTLDFSVDWQSKIS